MHDLTGVCSNGSESSAALSPRVHHGVSNNELYSMICQKSQYTNLVITNRIDPQTIHINKMLKLKSPVAQDELTQSSTDTPQDQSKLHRNVFLKDSKPNLSLPPLLKKPMKPSYSEMSMKLKVPTSPIAF